MINQFQNFKFIFIGGINRSGGSLLARLLDGHKNILSYPLELPLPHDNNFYNIFENYSGIPMTVPNKFNGSPSSLDDGLYGGNQSRSPNPLSKEEKTNINLRSILDIPDKEENEKIIYGKEKSSIIGVKHNYLEKAFYEKNIKTYFNYEKFINTFNENLHFAKDWRTLHNLRHFSYFSAWENGKFLSDSS